MIKNDRLLRAIQRKPIDCTPVWLMRQAGRYLPEYRSLRAQAGSFMTLCKTPDLACEVTLQPLRRFALDAAIIFSDILTIPDAMGMQLAFQEKVGPYFQNPVKSVKDVSQLPSANPEKLQYVYEAIKRVKQELKDSVPLIGFCGSPFTLAAYILEGHGKTHFPQIQEQIRTNPTMVKNLLAKLSENIVQHLNQQRLAGCDILMIFDTWGGLLQGQQYIEYSLDFIQEIVTQLKGAKHYNSNMSPLILFTRQQNDAIEHMAATGADVIGIDETLNLKEARERVGKQVILQGNLAPQSLLGDEKSIRDAVKQVLADYGDGGGHIFNLGHGVTPDVRPEHIAILVEAVHKESQRYHNVINSDYRNAL